MFVKWSSRYQALCYRQMIEKKRIDFLLPVVTQANLYRAH